jgi:hypothetical protein
LGWFPLEARVVAGDGRARGPVEVVGPLHPAVGALQARRGALVGVAGLGPLTRGPHHRVESGPIVHRVLGVVLGVGAWVGGVGVTGLLGITGVGGELGALVARQGLGRVAAGRRLVAAARLQGWAATLPRGAVGRLGGAVALLQAAHLWM